MHEISIQEFARRLRENYQILQEQAAKYGDIAVPISLLNQIADYEQAIGRVEQALAHNLPLDSLEDEFRHLNLQIDAVVFVAREGARASRSNNLPAQRTPLIGREQQVAQIRELLRQADVRLLTLTGPGGIGKTRLGIQVAAEICGDFADGTAFVGLGTVDDPANIIPAIAQALGMRETAEQAPANQLTRFLHNRRLLLLLDNFEHLVDHAALVGDLLEAAPGLKILVTSRSILSVYGEHEFVVPPLDLPDPTQLPALEQLTHYGAIQLFAERARGVKPAFALTDENAAAVAGICARVDGIPLAIELIAPGLRLFPPRALLDRLRSRLSAVARAARDLPLRQQTLRATIDWSYDLLDSAEQVVFARLAVFVGGCDLDAAAAVCAAGGESLDVWLAIAGLRDKSLLRQADHAHDRSRFTMFATIQEYALEKLAARGEAETIRRRHADYVLAFAQQAEPELIGAEQVAWLDRLEADRANVNASLQWLLGQSAIEQVAQLSAALAWFWFHRHGAEGLKWLNQALGQKDLLPRPAYAKLHYAAGIVTWGGRTSSAAQARELLNASLSAYQELGDRGGVAWALRQLGCVELTLSDRKSAVARFTESLALFQALDDRVGAIWTTHDLGAALMSQGQSKQARTYLDESLSLAETHGQTWAQALALANLSWLDAEEGQYQLAERRLLKSLDLSRAMNRRVDVINTLQRLAEVAERQGNAAAAAAYRDERLQEIERYKAARALESQT